MFPFEEDARAVLGIAIFIGIAYLFSENRKAVSKTFVFWGLVAQITIALLLTQVPTIVAALEAVTRAVEVVQTSAQAGAMFVFGYLGGGTQPFALESGSSTFIFAFQVIPAVFLVSGLAALLWHWGLLRWIVRGSGWIFGRVFRVSGPVGVSTSACIFFGMIEAPLLIRPLLPKLSRSELFIIMVDGLSVVGGSTMILIGSVLIDISPNAFTHLLTACLISTPMAITMARIMVPDLPGSVHVKLTLESKYSSSLDALVQGTINATSVAAHVIGLLIVFVGLMALTDAVLSQFVVADAPVTLQRIFGVILAPFAWLMGVPLSDLVEVGGLLGTKVAANEVVAYGQLMALGQGALNDRSTLISLYALCSFGNFGSVAILVGTLTAMVPEKRDQIIQLGMRALLAAFLTTCMTGAIVGVLHSSLGVSL